MPATVNLRNPRQNPTSSFPLSFQFSVLPTPHSTGLLSFPLPLFSQLHFLFVSWENHNRKRVSIPLQTKLLIVGFQSDMSWEDEIVMRDVTNAGLVVSDRIGREVSSQLDLEEALEASRYASHPYSTHPREVSSIRGFPLIVLRFNAMCSVIVVFFSSHLRS